MRVLHHESFTVTLTLRQAVYLHSCRVSPPFFAHIPLELLQAFTANSSSVAWDTPIAMEDVTREQLTQWYERVHFSICWASRKNVSRFAPKTQAEREKFQLRLSYLIDIRRGFADALGIIVRHAPPWPPTRDPKRLPA